LNTRLADLPIVKNGVEIDMKLVQAVNYLGGYIRLQGGPWRAGTDHRQQRLAFSVVFVKDFVLPTLIDGRQKRRTLPHGLKSGGWVNWLASSSRMILMLMYFIG
jgi:hypothetical protein